MVITPKMTFNTTKGKGIFILHDTLINFGNIEATKIETPVRLGGWRW